MKRILIVLVGLLILQGATKSQAKGPEAGAAEETGTKGWKITLASAGVGQSFYTPDLGYWNTMSEMRYWDTKFDAMRLWGGNVEFGIYNRVHLRAEGSYATSTARQTVIAPELGGGTQSKTLSLLPVSALLLYEFRDDVVIPYIGGGAGTVFVSSSNEKSQLSVPSTSGKSSSTDYMYYAVGGREAAGYKESVCGHRGQRGFWRLPGDGDRYTPGDEFAEYIAEWGSDGGNGELQILNNYELGITNYELCVLRGV